MGRTEPNRTKPIRIIPTDPDRTEATYIIPRTVVCQPYEGKARGANGIKPDRFKTRPLVLYSGELRVHPTTGEALGSHLTGPNLTKPRPFVSYSERLPIRTKTEKYIAWSKTFVRNRKEQRQTLFPSEKQKHARNRKNKKLSSSLGKKKHASPVSIRYYTRLPLFPFSFSPPPSPPPPSYVRTRTTHTRKEKKKSKTRKKKTRRKT